MELKDKKVIILVEDMFNVFEFWYPFYRLKEAGAQVTVVGSGRTEEFTGKPGTQVRPDINADQVSAGDYDGIIIPGGYAPDMMRRYPAMVNIVKDLFDAGKTVNIRAERQKNEMLVTTSEDIPGMKVVLEGTEFSGEIRVLAR